MIFHDMYEFMIFHEFMNSYMNYSDMKSLPGHLMVP